LMRFTAERTVGPARMIAESLTPKPGIREHNRHECDLRAAPTNVRSWESNGLYADVAFGPFDPEQS
jgi:hypothetical protein